MDSTIIAEVALPGINATGRVHADNYRQVRDDRASLGESRAMSRQMAPQGPWDGEEMFFPGFCLVEPSVEYIHELSRASSYYKQSWLAITSSAPSIDRLLTEIKPSQTDKDSVPTPTPFLNSTVPQIYSHFKSHLRRPDDFDYEKHPFTHFAFLVIDQQCLERTDSESPSDFTILLCSDAPDLHESQTRLKTLRLPIEAAFKHLEGVEDLTISPSEVYTRVFEDPEAEILTLFPIPSLIDVPPFTGVGSSDQRYKPGTPAEMRGKKADAFRRIERAQRQEVIDDEA